MLQAENDRMKRKTIYLAFGANQKGHLGTIQEIINTSYGLLHDEYLTIVEHSHFFKTPAYPAGSGPDYVNTVVKAETFLSPSDLLTALHDVEKQLGRVRQQRWGARVIDIDLLDYQDEILPSRQVYQKWRDMPLALQKTTWPNELILPHPRIQDRGFVLIPFKEVAPDWVHPVTHRTIDTLIAQLPPDELAEIVQLKSC